MRTNALLSTLLCLFLFWMRSVDTMKNCGNVNKKEAVPLSMCEKSVDDMYSYCSEKMSNKINKYFQKENNGKFEKAWKSAGNCVNRSLKEKNGALTKDYIHAICAYTAGGDLYKDFNEAVRTERKKYGSSFPFHSLHFWLTRAIQILNNDQTCYTTYRRTKTNFTGEVNQEIRFGSFASSSNLTNLTHFGDVTCFKINTCFGAYLQKYPSLQDREQEVLIPPYEKFKIQKKYKKEKREALADLPDCKIVYVLKSTGTLSNLDCQLAKNMLV